MHQRTKWHSNQGMDYKDNRKGDYIEECIKGRNGSRTKWHSNQGMDNKGNRKGGYIEECIKGRNGTVIKAWATKLIEKEVMDNKG